MGLSSSSARKKPSGSTEAKQASSARPGFQPSAAAQSTASEISSGRIVRMVRASIAGGPFRICDFSRHDEEDDLSALAREKADAIPLALHSRKWMASLSLYRSCATRKADVCSPEMAHFFAQNILVPCALFSEN